VINLSRENRLRSRILLSILVILALMLAGLVFYGHMFVEDKVFDQYLQLQETSGRMSAQTFEEFIDASLRQLQVMAKDPDIVRLTENGKLKLQGLQAVMGGLVGNVTRLDRNMRIAYTYPVDKQAIGKFVGDQAHNVKLLETKNPLVGECFMAVQGYEAMPLVQPVFRDGVFDGTLTMLMRIAWLDKVFWKPMQQMGAGGIAALVNEEGEVIWSKGIVQEAGSFRPENLSECGLDELREAFQSQPEDLSVSLRTKLPAKPGKWIVAVTTIRVADSRWHMLSGIRDDELAGSISTYRVIVLASASVVTLLGVLLALYLVGARRQYLIAEERARLADQFEMELKARTEQLASAKAELEKHARGLEKLIAQHTKKLQESEELYRQLVENVSTIIFLLDKGKLIYTNPPFRNSLQMEDGEAELANREFIDMVGVDSRPALLNALARLSEGETTYDLEGFEVLGKDNETRVWEGSVKRLETWSKDRFLGFFRDVTEQKHLEHQVLQAQKLESVGRLAGGIAHDFNNILAGIFGNLALLKEQVGGDGGDEEVRKLFNTIETASRRGADLTRKLLYFSRKETEDRKVVDLKQSVEEVSGLLRTTMPQNVEYKRSICEEPLKILGSATEIQQVLLNLCINAIEAMPNGGKLQVIAARVQAGEDPNFQLDVAPSTEFARIRVTDSGTGISPEVKNSIFEPFFTTKEPGKGTGLGLSIAYSIINKHGGTIEIDSDWGRGSVFSVYLPIAEDRTPGAEATREYQIPDFSKAKPILVADDEEMIVQPVQRFFAKHGLVVFTAEDGVDAIEEFKRHQHEIGLVLLDLRMPRLSGTEAFSIIHHLNPSIVGVLMTGFGEDMASTDHVRMGLSEVLQKPFTFEELSQVLEKYLL